MEGSVATARTVCYGRGVILSFYERKDSPWVWVQYALHAGDTKRYEKTTIRKDEAHKKQKKARYRAELEERLLAEIDGAGDPVGENGWGWVLPWIGVRHKARTAQVYRAHWRAIAAFLYETGINAPILLERQHCFDYVSWRTKAVKQKSKRNPSANTAIGELKLLAQVMDEAKVRRLFRGDNPVRKLGIEREAVVPKPEFSDAEIQTITEALKRQPVWMQRSFHLALRTGLRFAETRLIRSQVDWGNRLVHIENPKGGRGRAFSIPIYDSIEPMLKEWWATSDAYFCDIPEKTITGLTWTNFFREIKLPHLCFHCTRVTFISRGARAGISEGMMMKLVNHASEEVHRIYQRLPPEDAARLVATIPIPGDPGATAQSQRKK